jgi:hypothetical protein
MLAKQNAVALPGADNILWQHFLAAIRLISIKAMPPAPPPQSIYQLKDVLQHEAIGRSFHACGIYTQLRGNRRKGSRMHLIWHHGGTIQ